MQLFSTKIRLILRLVLFLCLFLLLENLQAQNGKYQIDTVNGNSAEGTITINPYTITIEHDSLKVVLPVVRIIDENRRTYYILEGCLNNISFQGAAIYHNYELRYSNGLRYGLSLYVEIRTRQGYSMTRYGMFYYE